MLLALFDLDNTVLDGDSDIVWGELLSEHGAMDVERVRAFHAEYYAGTLDIDAFLRFQLEPLAREPMERLCTWRAEFVERRIKPRISDAARARVGRHAQLGHELALITATNAFITEPIARELGIPHLIATQPEMRDGRFTGRVDGRPCFREGKIHRLEEWLRSRDLIWSDVRECWFYSDSHNDLPLLSIVHHPIAVDPDDKLRAHAERSGWPIVHLQR